MASETANNIAVRLWGNPNIPPAQVDNERAATVIDAELQEIKKVLKALMRPAPSPSAFARARALLKKMEMK